MRAEDIGLLEEKAECRDLSCVKAMRAKEDGRGVERVEWGSGQKGKNSLSVEFITGTLH